jgi:hypothetical protein
MSGSGYIYCVSNESMPYILNIGITKTTPEIRVDGINGLTGNWRPPTPYKCEFAKRVWNIDRKIVAIHRLFAYCRIHPEREFFRMSLEEARSVFDLLDDEDDTGLHENRKVEIKAFEERMFECLFQKSDVFEADFVKKKAELREINETIERRKNELANLNINATTQTEHPNYITEY